MSDTFQIVDERPVHGACQRLLALAVLAPGETT